jgi:hypothetical protein
MAQAQAVGKVSKNQRAGIRSVQKKHTCSQGHVLVRVMIAPGFKGRNRFEWMCECNGFTPMTAGKGSKE